MEKGGGGRMERVDVLLFKRALLGFERLVLAFCCWMEAPVVEFRRLGLVEAARRVLLWLLWLRPVWFVLVESLSLCGGLTSFLLELSSADVGSVCGDAGSS